MPPADQESTERAKAPRGGGLLGGGGGTRAGGRSSKTKWRDVIPVVAVIVALLLATLAILNQRRFLSDDVPTEGTTGTAALSGETPSASATTQAGAWPRLVHTIGHSFTSSGQEASAVAHALGPSWVSTTSGVGGESVATIAARAGALPWVLHVEGGSIPESGRVDVELDQGGQGTSKNRAWPLLQNGAGENDKGTGQNNDGAPGIRGTLAGVKGALMIERAPGTAPAAKHFPQDVYYFQRDETGKPVELNDGQATFKPSYIPSQLDGIVLIHAAYNDLKDPDIAVRTIQKIIDLVPSERWLVLAEWPRYSPKTPAGAITMEFNKKAAAKWGDHFVDTYRYAVTDAVADAGLTVSEADREDLAVGLVPRSLTSEDKFHPNEVGFTAIARIVVQQIEKLGIARPDA